MNNVPYYAVIFTSQLSIETDDYEIVADEMVKLAVQKPGFVNVESVRDKTGFGITISYWESLEAIQQWKEHAAHTIATKGE